MEYLSQYRRSPDRALNTGPPENGAGFLTTQPLRSVIILKRILRKYNMRMWT
jgi:hypothetical protein